MSDYKLIKNKLATLINLTENMIQNIRRQHFSQTATQLRIFSTHMSDFFTLATPIFDTGIFNNLLSYLEQVNQAQNAKDYVLLGDILEIQLLASFYELQGMVLANDTAKDSDFFAKNITLAKEHPNVISKPVLTLLENWYQTLQSEQKQNIYDNYLIEPTNSGFLTLAKHFDGHPYYLHSNTNPWKESRLFAEEYGDNDCFDYVIAGFGLGYHIHWMLAKDARYQLKVLESDLNILGMAFCHMDFTYILSSNRLQIIYSPDFSELGASISDEKTSLIIHYPSLITMPEGKAKDALNQYFLQASSIQEQKQLLDENFYYNQKLQDESIDILKEDFKNKEVIYLAGGPSTEHKLSFIQAYLKKHPDTITICAGKVYRVLLAAGLTPDFVIISDSKTSLVWQLQNIQETKTRLCYLATASRTAIQAFQGKRYILYQNGYEESEKIASINDYLLFETGGSVSTLAIDAAVKLGCKKLITTGLDLSYPKNHTHAFGIGGNTTSDQSCTTIDISGNKVKTSPTFRLYQKWIEEYVQKTPNIEFINITEGVKIQGMKNVEQI